MDAATISQQYCGRHWSWGRSFRTALVTAVAAGAVSAIVYLLASALGAIPQDVIVSGVAGKEPLTLGLAVTTSTLVATLAIAVFGLMQIVSKQPVRLFRIVAAVVLLVSLASPFSITGASGQIIAALIALHIAVAATIVGVLTAPTSR